MRLKMSWIMILGFTLMSYQAAFADHTYVYLGGALSADHCQTLAENRGYRASRFGGYFDGYYYWNACFAVNYLAPITPVEPTPKYDCRAAGGDATHPSGEWYRVTVPYVGVSNSEQKANVRKVIKRIEREFDFDIRCFSDCVWEHKLHCLDKTRRGEAVTGPALKRVYGVLNAIGAFREAEDTTNSF